MKRFAVFVLMIGAILLSGCTREAQPQQLAEEFRNRIKNADSISVSADITADCGETMEEYAVACKWQAEKTELTVTAPEDIAGVGAVIENSNLQLTYDGLILDVHALPGGNLSPLCALSAMLNSLRDGYLVSAWSETYGEQAAIAMDLTVDDTVRQRLWVSRDGGTPLAFELIQGESVVLYCEITDWIISMKTAETVPSA